MTTAQVVEHLSSDQAVPGNASRQRIPGHAGYMDRPIILMETQNEGNRTAPGGNVAKWAAELPGAGVGAVNHYCGTYREGVVRPAQV